MKIIYRVVCACLLFSFSTSSWGYEQPPGQDKLLSTGHSRVCSLYNVDLSGQDLTNANFKGAKLVNTNMDNVKKDGAQFD